MTPAADELIVRSPAKINLLLRVLEKREDGFHEIETVFQTISLHDRISIREEDSDSLRCSDPAIPIDQTNLVWRAVAGLREIAPIPPLSIQIEKAIPAGGGLGGGSSNAARTLVALRDRYAPRLGDGRLAEMAAALGSDVPFFLGGGTAYATGRGEVLTPLPPLEPMRLILLLPDERVSTAEAYGRLGRTSSTSWERLGVERAAAMIRRGPMADPDAFVNDFEEVVFASIPRLGELRLRMIEAGARWARMSGSGSTIVGAFADEESRQKALRSFRDVRAVPAETL